MAKVYAALGEKEKAVTLLKKAHLQGTRFHWFNYDNSVYFKSLIGHPSFEAFIKPK